MTQRKFIKVIKASEGQSQWTFYIFFDFSVAFGTPFSRKLILTFKWHQSFPIFLFSCSLASPSYSSASAHPLCWYCLRCHLQTSLYCIPQVLNPKFTQASWWKFVFLRAFLCREGLQYSSDFQKGTNLKKVKCWSSVPAASGWQTCLLWVMSSIPLPQLPPRYFDNPHIPVSSCHSWTPDQNIQLPNNGHLHLDILQISLF